MVVHREVGFNIRLVNLKKINVKDYSVIGFDLKEVDLHLPGLRTYVQDVTQREEVKAILDHHQIEKFDFIQSDMAPNTMDLRILMQ